RCLWGHLCPRLIVRSCGCPGKPSHRRCLHEIALRTLIYQLRVSRMLWLYRVASCVAQRASSDKTPLCALQQVELATTLPVGGNAASWCTSEDVIVLEPHEQSLPRIAAI